MKHPAALGFLAMAMALSVLPGTAQAQAQAAYTSTTVHLRAGPGADYPVVAILPAGLQISVQGCVNDYSWCDVAAGPNRGWVYAGYINYYYQNSYVPLLNYGTLIGIGILPFILDDYWGSHYHDRPWYPERDRWAERHPPARIHPPQQHRPPGGSGWVAPRPHPPSAAPRQPRPPGAAPRQPRPPGAAPQQPRAPGGAPSVAPRPSTRPAPAPGVAPTRPPSGSGWSPGSQESPAK